jgi:hypothetical protein
VNLIATLNVAPNEADHQRLLLTAFEGTLFSWGSLSVVGTGISTGRNVQAAPYLQKLYIANDADPKVYRYATNDVVNWSADGVIVGIIPTNCRLICEWANRMVLAADPANPNVWNMSRIDNPNDWLFAADDDGSPVASSDIIGGQISEPITSLIPHNRDCLIIGTANSMRVWRGNPVAGGVLETIAHVTGPVNGTAWCKTPDDWTYLLTRDGLYRMQPGCGSNPLQVSRPIIPESLLNIDGVTNTAYLAYDVRFRCLHIYVTGVFPEYWLFQVEHESFWPVTVPGESILSIARHDPIETTDISGVLVGTSTGLKRLDRTAPLGGESPAFARMPYREGALGRKSIVRRANVKFASNTNDLNGTVDFYGGENIEDVVSLPVHRRHRSKIEHIQNNHNNCNPRIGGQSGLIAITQSNTDRHWSFEAATLYAGHMGQERG